MLRSRRFWPIMAVLVGIVLFGTAPSADAAFRLRVAVPTGPPSDGVVITDNAPGDLSPLTGAIVFSGSLPGGFLVNVTTGISQPPLAGGNAFATLHLSSVNVQAAGAGSIQIWLENDGFTGGPDGGLILEALLGGVLSAPAGSTANFQSWVNPANAQPNLNPPGGADVFPAGPVGGPVLVPGGSVPAFAGGGATFGPGAFATSAAVGFTKSGPYSLFARATITFSGTGIVSFDEEQRVVPAPAALVLVLSALPVLGIGYLRRRWQKAIA